MEFCPKCGTRLLLGSRKRDSSKLCLKCPKCGYEVRSRKNVIAAVKRMEKSQIEPIVVIGEQEAKIKTLPTERVECPNCGNMEAYVWIVQTRGADESSTQFFRCTKCGYTWREYS